MSRERQSTDKFGWCLPHTEDHPRCRTEYVDMNGNTRRCGCECHSTAAPRKRAARRKA